MRTPIIAAFDRASLADCGYVIGTIGYTCGLEYSAVDKFPKNVPFKNELFIIALIVTGSLHLRINLVSHHAQPDQVIVISPQFFFELTAVSDDLDVDWLIADRHFIESSGIHPNAAEFGELFSGSLQCLQVDADGLNVIRALLSVLNHHIGKPDAMIVRVEIARHSLSGLLYSLVLNSRTGTSSTASFGRKEDLILRLLRLIMNHYKTERAVTFYAERLFVTAKYLATVCSEVIGKPPTALIADAVLAEARMLLKNPALTIAAISNELNFSDQSVFGKYFKKQTGLSPTDYRQQLYFGKG